MDDVERIKADLRGLGDLTTRPMFGGHGLYWRDVIFGMVFRDRLYFKVDDPSKEVTTPAVLPAYPFTENDDRARSIRREGLESGRAVARHSGFPAIIGQSRRASPLSLLVRRQRAGWTNFL
jgi:DNA transformation protein